MIGNRRWRGIIGATDALGKPNPRPANLEFENHMNSHRRKFATWFTASILVGGCTGLSDPTGAPSKTTSEPSTIVGRWNLLTLDHGGRSP